MVTAHTADMAALRVGHATQPKSLICQVPGALSPVLVFGPVPTAVNSLETHQPGRSQSVSACG